MNKERFNKIQKQSMRIVLLFLAFFVSVSVKAQEGSVVINRKDIKNGVVLFGENDNLFPVTLEIDLNLKNMVSTEGDPITVIIPGKSEIKITELMIDKKNASWGMKYSYTFYQGSIYAKHSRNFIYKLPYKKGESYRLDQGYGGKFSHRGDSKYSLDFQMELGTEIYAARAGVVVEIEERYSEGGNDRSLVEKANFISVLHDDGTFAQYSHLKKDGALVKKGQKVRAGDKIGLSGATGFATGPHLHFNVIKAKRGGGFQTLPVKFSTKDGIKELKEGEVYVGY